MAVLGELLKEISYECVCGTTEQEITDVIYDSRKVTAGCLFVCIPGLKRTAISLRRMRCVPGRRHCSRSMRWNCRKGRM